MKKKDVKSCRKMLLNYRQKIWIIQNNTTLFYYASHTQQKLVSRWGVDKHITLHYNKVRLPYITIKYDYITLQLSTITLHYNKVRLHYITIKYDIYMHLKYEISAIQ